MSDPSPTALLTPVQVGRIYAVSADTVLRWHHAGLIPAEVSVGQIYRFDPDEVAAALKRNARKKAKEKASGSLA